MPLAISELAVKIETIKEVPKKSWDLISVKKSCMISTYDTYYKLLMILPSIPSELPMRVLHDIESYKTRNSRLTESRRCNAINSNTDVAMLKYASLFPIIDKVKDVRFLRYWDCNKMYCSGTEGFIDFAYFEI